MRQATTRRTTEGITAETQRRRERRGAGGDSNHRRPNLSSVSSVVSLPPLRLCVSAVNAVAVAVSVAVRRPA